MQQKKILKGRVKDKQKNIHKENIAPSKETTTDFRNKSQLKWNTQDDLNHNTEKMKKELVFRQMNQRLCQNAEWEDLELLQNADLEDPELLQNEDQGLRVKSVREKGEAKASLRSSIFCCIGV